MVESFQMEEPRLRANGRTKAESNIVENENYNIQEIEESRDFKKKRRNGKENQKKLSNGNSV